MITENTGGMPGKATTTFLACAAAGLALSNAASRAALATRLKFLRIIESSILSCFLAFQNEFGFAGFAHQGRPNAFAQFGKARQLQGLARARLRQVDDDVFVDAR